MNKKYDILFGLHIRICFYYHSSKWYYTDTRHVLSWIKCVDLQKDPQYIFVMRWNTWKKYLILQERKEPNRYNYNFLPQYFSRDLINTQHAVRKEKVAWFSKRVTKWNEMKSNHEMYNFFPQERIGFMIE